MRNWLSRVLAGRNGTDNFSRFLSLVGCVLLVLALIFSRILPAVSTALWLVALVCLVYDYWRIFSRNIYKRRAENARYLQTKQRVLSFFRQRKEMFSQRRDYRFFKCPSCHATMRVPRGKGKVQIICRKCGSSFLRKT